MQRFTIDGSPELEEHLERICRVVADEILALIPRKKVEGILLGGGYGRGHGGVLKTENGDLPYNDLEFYVCLSGIHLLNQQRYERPLHLLAEKLSSQAGVELEFKISSAAKLARSPISMFYYDLVVGHRLIWGDEHLLRHCHHHRVAPCIPVSEATRLLMNRCSGLLYAQEYLKRDTFPSTAADFVGRNIAKAQLAYGDAILTLFGLYHWDCLERDRRLSRLQLEERLPEFNRIRQNYRDGLDFKLHPRCSEENHTALSALHEEVMDLGLQLWLWVERHRLKHPFDSARAYACNPIRKCPETPCWRNQLINLKKFGPSILLGPDAGRHPRERLLNSLPLLLWEPATPYENHLLALVQKELRTSAVEFTDLVSAYRQLWKDFS